MAAPLDRQIRLLGAHGVFTYPFACVPFLYFYFAERGIDLRHYLQLIAWYYWAMVIMEVPTGTIADRFGRRGSLVAGSLTLAAGFVTIWCGNGFGAFRIGEVLFGIGHALLSGTPTALLYDTLKHNGQPGYFLVAESRIHALRLFGTGGSFLFGGAIASTFGIGPTILLTAMLCTTGAVIACFLREEPRPSGRTPPLVLAALRDLRSGPLLWLIGYFVLLFGLLRFAFHTYQPYFRETVFDASDTAGNWLVLGILFAALNLLAAPCSRLAPWLTRRFRFRVILPWLPASLCAAFLLMAVLPNRLGVLLFFVHQVPFGLHWALVQDFVNSRVATVSRATALSIVSLAGRVSFASWIPFAGEFGEQHGTPATYGAVGLIGLLLTVLWCSPGLGTRLLDRTVRSVEPPAPPPAPPGS